MALNLAGLAEKSQKLAWKEAKKDPKVFFRSFVKTLDEHDKEHPIKRFPRYKVFDLLTDRWMTLSEGNGMTVAKSRQLMASWWAISIVLWELMSSPGRLAGVISKKENDAAKLIGETRMGIVYNNLPAWLKDKYPMECTKTVNTIRHGAKHPPSVVIAMPQGAHQARMHTFSILFFDEAAFQDSFEEAVVGAKPTLHGGGKMLAVSSAAPGTFEDIWKGRWGGE